MTCRGTSLGIGIRYGFVLFVEMMEGDLELDGLGFLGFRWRKLLDDMAPHLGKADVSMRWNSKTVITFGVSLVLSWYRVGNPDSGRSDLYPEILRDQAVARLNELGKDGIHLEDLLLFSGITVQDVLKENSIEVTEESFLQLKYDPQSVRGYIEVLLADCVYVLSLGLPLAVVKGIAGQTRLKVTVSGVQGHAGTVPMAAAAELIGLLESLCKDPESYLSYDGHCNGFAADSLAGSLVCTVGEISSWPSASNVIPGKVMFTIDLRAMEDMAREAILFRIQDIIIERSIACNIERKHDSGAVVCDPGLSSKMKSSAYSALKKMVGEVQDEVPVLMSGAGHDAMAMSHLAEVSMLFVRCRGGISHSPAEQVLDDDIWAAGLAVLEFLDQHVT
ncbi:allantoate deiminase 1-like [Macadamia integrifolia]|uniref:allantoate deiminase 1-like n=1 Tax=Macadamia integrifolia TaxID=60698 RepID=UPI001C4EA100|nr:allantoate deiminase 1-like [Macadamia integrifolia]